MTTNADVSQRMGRPIFNRQISFGNVVTFISMLVGAVWFFAEVKGDIRIATVERNQITAASINRDASIRAEFKSSDQRIEQVTNQRIVNIESDIADIKDILKDINRKLDK